MPAQSSDEQKVMIELFDSIFIASHLCGDVLHVLPLCSEHRAVVLSVMGSIDVGHTTLVDQDYCIICQRANNYAQVNSPSPIQQSDPETRQEVLKFGSQDQRRSPDGVVEA